MNEEERRNKQDLITNLAILTDLRKAGKSDRFGDAVDYRALKKRIVAMVEGSHYYLVEAVAWICREHAAVAGVRVLMEEPSARRFAKSAGVEIVRRKTS